MNQFDIVIHVTPAGISIEAPEPILGSKAAILGFLELAKFAAMTAPVTKAETQPGVKIPPPGFDRVVQADPRANGLRR